MSIQKKTRITLTFRWTLRLGRSVYRFQSSAVGGASSDVDFCVYSQYSYMLVEQAAFYRRISNNNGAAYINALMRTNDWAPMSDARFIQMKVTRTQLRSVGRQTRKTLKNHFSQKLSEPAQQQKSRRKKIAVCSINDDGYREIIKQHKKYGGLRVYVIKLRSWILGQIYVLPTGEKFVIFTMQMDFGERRWCRNRSSKSGF